MWYDVDWVAQAQQLMPSWWRKPRFVAYVRVLVSQVRYLHGLFLLWRDRVLFDITHTGQTMSLEHWLNERFDPVERRIVVLNQAPVRSFLFRVSEGQTGPALYRRWNIATAYTTGQRVAFSRRVWQAASGNTGVAPVPVSSTWTLVEEMPVVQTHLDMWNQIDFVIEVPTALVFDESAMRQLVDQYRQAGKRYTITAV